MCSVVNSSRFAWSSGLRTAMRAVPRGATAAEPVCSRGPEHGEAERGRQPAREGTAMPVPSWAGGSGSARSYPRVRRAAIPLASLGKPTK
jgi:hypothetical protein